MLQNRLSFISFLLLFIIACDNTGPTESVTETEEVSSDTTDLTFDPVLAEEVGADQYGMKRYVMAFLKAGPNRDRSEEEAQALQRAHMENITRMAEAGQLIIAGPFLDEGEMRGIYVFNVETIEEARALTETDPAIKAGSLVMELHPWYASAALMKLSDLHTKVAKEKI